MVPGSPSQVFSCISAIVPEELVRKFQAMDMLRDNAWVTAPHKKGMRIVPVIIG